MYASHGHCEALQGPTWQQAVQYIQEVPLKGGERYTVTVKHDTYGLSFSLRSDAGNASLLPIVNGSSQAPAPVPLYVRLQLSQTCACSTCEHLAYAKDLQGASSCLHH